jgi:uncharacterized protein with beta-barrel porin domain
VQGSTLGGNGMINGGVTVGPGGVVNPGASIGAFTTAGLLLFDTGSVYGLEIDSGLGTADQVSAVNVTIGTGVNLYGQEIGTSTLLPVGFQFRIIDNTSSNATAGFFAGLEQGAQFGVGGNLFSISYTGGDGNDVVITSLGIPEPGVLGLLATGALFIVRRRR